MKKTILPVLLFVIIIAMSVLLFACEGVVVEQNEEGITVRPIDTTNDTTDESNETSLEDESEHEHAFGEWQIVDQATCIGNGMRKKSCACGQEVEEEIPPLGHAIEHHDAQASTCIEIGWHAYDTCSRCDYTTYSAIAAKGHRAEDDLSCPEVHTCVDCGLTFTMEHAFKSENVIMQKSCISAGREEIKCNRCEEKKTLITDASGHNYSLCSFKEPTCIEGGQAIYACSYCGDEYSVYYDAMGHSTARGTCSYCGETITVWDDELAAVNKKLDDRKKEIQESNERSISIKKGTLSSYLSSLGYSEYRFNQYTTAHYQRQMNDSYQNWQTYNTRYTYASIGGYASDAARYKNYADRYYNLYSEYSKLYQAGQLRDEIKDLEDDLDYYLDVIEGARRSEVAEINRKYESLIRPSKPIENRSTYSGFIFYYDESSQTYSLNGVSNGIATDLSIPATHNGKPVTKIAPNAFANSDVRTLYLSANIDEIGVAAFYGCADLAEVYYSHVPSVIGGEAFSGTKYVEDWGHDLVKKEDLAPTCTESGYHDYYICSRCAYESKTEDPALGHDPVKQADLDPTCTEEGYHDYYICSRCGHETKEIDEALGHDPINHEAKVPTCTEIGWDAYETCSRCDYTTYEQLAEIPHTWDHPEYLSVTTPGDYDMVCEICHTEQHIHVGQYTRVDAQGNPDENGNYLLFGSYPQSKVEDESLIAVLSEKAGSLPTNETPYLWTASAKDGGYYIDIEHSSAKYRGIYRSQQLSWYKFEAIKWRILSEDGETAFILSENILDASRFDPSYNNYEESEIRAYLCGDFYSTAFLLTQQELIEETDVVNSAASTGYSSNGYVCNNTLDKVFLLSYSEVSNVGYGFGSDEDRAKNVTEYASANGVTANDQGTGCWWLRSPYNSLYYGRSHTLTYGVRSVLESGYLYPNDDVNYAKNGIVPALRISFTQA